MGGILDAFDDSRSLLLITSDHGNIEDERTRRHTRNPVPAIVAGARRHEFAAGLRSLTDVTPAIVRIIDTSGDRRQG